MADQLISHPLPKNVMRPVSMLLGYITNGCIISFEVEKMQDI